LASRLLVDNDVFVDVLQAVIPEVGCECGLTPDGG
jgi:hypothetical protein